MFLHEFGHNLNLRHGGNENRNYKPQYQSVMNYMYSLPGLAKNDGSLVFDYSGKKLNDLDEASLVESAGVGAALFRTRWFDGGAAGGDQRGCGSAFRSRCLLWFRGLAGGRPPASRRQTFLPNQ